MRLSAGERQSILDCVHQKDPDALVYLYGSRLDDSLKGGDIDLLVLSRRLGFPDKIDLLIAIKDRLGEQRIDLSIKSRESAEQDPFFAKVLKSGALLNGGGGGSRTLVQT